MPRSKRMVPRAFSPVCAGEGDMQDEGFEAIDINEMITNGADHFRMYTVTGDSQAPRIEPGDEVVVDPAAEPKVGDRILVLLNGLNAIKFFQPSHRGLHLVSSNGKYPAREVTEQDDFQIIGVVKARISLF